MKTQTVIDCSIFDHTNEKEIGLFTGTVEWFEDMGKVTNILGIAKYKVESIMPCLSSLKVDENSKGNIFALFVE